MSPTFAAFCASFPTILHRTRTTLSTRSFCQPLRSSCNPRAKRSCSYSVKTLNRVIMSTDPVIPDVPLPTSGELALSTVGHMPIFAQCMLRVNDPVKSDRFYGDGLGMTLLTRFDFPDFKFSLFFYAYTDVTPPSQDLPQAERADWLWARPEPTVELTWNWDADSYEESVAKMAEGANGDEVYVNGNQSPCGFGFLQITVADVTAAVGLMSAAGAPVLTETAAVATAEGVFSATVGDPDGYHVRLVGASGGAAQGVAMRQLDPIFSSVMLRVQDPRSAIPFFNRLGLSLLTREDYDDLQATDYFMAYSEKTGHEFGWTTSLRECSLTVRHVWGSEEKAGDVYTNGNVRPHRGFGHVGIIVDDVEETMKNLEAAGYKVVKKAGPFADVGTIAFIAEPSTGYWIEIIARVGEPPSVSYCQPVFAQDPLEPSTI